MLKRILFYFSLSLSLSLLHTHTHTQTAKPSHSLPPSWGGCAVNPWDWLRLLQTCFVPGWDDRRRVHGGQRRARHQRAQACGGGQDQNMLWDKPNNWIAIQILKYVIVSIITHWLTIAQNIKYLGYATHLKIHRRVLLVLSMNFRFIVTLSTVW